MYKNTDSIFLDVERDREKLVQLIPEYDVVVSLLPYSLHPKIAQLCIKNKVNMVTASYSHGLTKGPEGESLSKRYEIQHSEVNKPKKGYSERNCMWPGKYPRVKIPL